MSKTYLFNYSNNAEIYISNYKVNFTTGFIKLISLNNKIGSNANYKAFKTNSFKLGTFLEAFFT